MIFEAAQYVLIGRTKCSVRSNGMFFEAARYILRPHGMFCEAAW
jgi:hypothetical protein